MDCTTCANYRHATPDELKAVRLAEVSRKNAEYEAAHGGPEARALRVAERKAREAEEDRQAAEAKAQREAERSRGFFGISSF